jgi:hypothetical protein
MEYLNVPAEWAIRLADGAVATIWADGYSTPGDEYVFSSLARCTEEEQALLDIVGRTPSDPSKVIVAILRISAANVAEVWTAGT